MKNIKPILSLSELMVLNILTYSPLFGHGSLRKINQNVRVTGQAYTENVSGSWASFSLSFFIPL
jgi:hypothetical protein